jgi:hypothetical protein
LLESFPIRDSIAALVGEPILRIAAPIGLMIVALLLAAAPASAGTRVALVIGNGAYQNAPLLSSPVNDAADLSTSLGRLGFDVKTLTNARYDDMRQALSEFGQQARGAEFAIIFFAGHGFQIGGENWLIPVNARLAIDLDVVNETIGLHSLMRAVSNATKLGLVILDASRNDPFQARMQSTNLPRSVERGFSRVEPPDNVLVVYAASDGTTANDGSGRNSPFTSSLLKSIEMPGLEIRLLFANVRDDVMTATNRRQQPFIYGSMSRGQIFLRSSSPKGENSAETSSRQSDVALEAETTKKFKDKFAPPTSATSGMLDRDIIALLQTELAARGCYLGPVTGDWNSNLIRAITIFNSKTFEVLDAVRLKPESIDVVRHHSGHVCSSPCWSSEAPGDNGQCVKITCPAGASRDVWGDCTKPGLSRTHSGAR